MEEILKFALLGLGIGSMYVLAAQGLIVIFRGSGVLNLALGAIGMVGAYTTWLLQTNLGLPAWINIPAGAAASAVIGVLVQLLIMRPLRRRAPLVRVIATLGVLLTLQALAILIFGPSPKNPKSQLPLTQFTLFGEVKISLDRIFLLAIAILVTIALYLYYRFTKFGLGTTAVAENETTAATLGWSPNRIALINWIIGSALAGVAAILIMPISTLQPGVMTSLVLAATSTALVASFRSFPIALGTGLAVGVVETVVRSRFPSLTGIGEAVPFAFIVIWMIARGRGIPQRDYILQRLPSVGAGKIRWTLVGAVVAVVFAMTFSVSNMWFDAFIITMTVGIMLLSVVVLTGYAGQLSLAQFAIAIFGAYVAGRLSATMDIPYALAILIGVAATIPLGLLFALPAVRTRGINLAILTLGLGTVMELVLFKNQNLTGGIQGTLLPDPYIFGINLEASEYPARYTWWVLIVLLLCVLVVANVRRGRSGRRLLAVRANERAAAALGVSVFGAKLFAFGLGAGLAALGGILYVFRNGSVSYAKYTNFDSIVLVGNAMIGGIGYLAGAPLGGTLFGGGLNSRILDSLGDGMSRWIPLIGGVALVLMVLLNQDGIVKETVGQAKLVTSYLRNGTKVSRFVLIPIIGLALGTATIAFVPGLPWWNWFRIELAIFAAAYAVGLRGWRGRRLVNHIIAALIAVAMLLLENFSTTVISLVVGMIAATLVLQGRGWCAAAWARWIIGLGVPVLAGGAAYAAQVNLGGGVELLITLLAVGGATLAASAPAAKPGLSALALGIPALAAVGASAAGLASSGLPLLVTAIILLAIVPLFSDRPLGLGVGLIVILGALLMPIAAYLREQGSLAVFTMLIAQATVMCAIVHMAGSARLRTSLFVIAEAILGALFFLMLTMWPVSVTLLGLAVIKLIMGVRDLSPAAINLPESTELTPVTPKTLEAHGVTVRYGGTTAVDSVDLAIRPGRILGLIGPNGAGKTSFIDAITGFAKPAEGRILLDGVDVTAWSTVKRSRAGVGRSFQALELFEDMTVIDNLRAASEPRDFFSYLRDLVWPKQAKAPAALISAVNEFKLRDDLPRGVDDLSYGKRRLLAIARAVAAQPSVLLLDEPAAGLNESETRELATLVKRLAHEWNMSILLVEHDVNFVMSVCDEIVVLDFGCKISQGTPAEVRNDPAVIAAYLGQEDPDQAHQLQDQIEHSATTTRED